jgi:hypothetical protein
MTELMKRYEAETGCSSTTIWRGEIVASGKYIEWLEAQLTEQTLEKFLEIIRTQCDEISALKAKVAELEKENARMKVVDNRLVTNGEWSKV